MKIFFLFIIGVLIFTASYYILTGIVALLFDFSWLDVRQFPPSVVVFGIGSLLVAGFSVDEIENKYFFK